VEWFFGWLKKYSKITVRHERNVKDVSRLVYLACILILWRVMR
jgi:hypothetical protein